MPTHAPQATDVVAQLQQAAQAAREDLGDGAIGAEGRGVREAGRLGPGDERLRW